MIIGSVLEDQKIEKRVPIVPEILKKYKDLNFEIYLSKGYGKHLGIEDNEYEKEGAKIFDDNRKIIETYYESIASGDFETVISLMHEDVVFNIVGETPYAG